MICKTMKSALSYHTSTRKNTFVWLMFISCLLLTQIVLAGEEKFVARQQGSTIQQGLTMTIQDDKYIDMLQNPSGPNAWNTIFDIHNLDNFITLSIDPYNRASVLNTEFSITVELQVTYDVWDYGTASFKNKVLPENIILKVDNKVDVNASQNYKSVYKFPGGNKLRVSVVNVTSTIAVPAALTLETEIAVERYYRMDPNALVNTIENKSIYISNRGELEVTWAYLPGAEEYEIEWTHMDNYRVEQNAMASSPLAIQAPGNIPFTQVDFNTNATRVTTTSNYYRIPLMYERGYILYRVRAVGRNRNADFNKNYFTRWSDANFYNTVATFINKFLITETVQLNGNLNWQSSTSFAEEGKNKSSVSYFDGSLRNRQTVTKMNTQDEVIAGETIYDAQGRPMIQVLPAPVPNAKPSYKPNLNVNTIDGKPFGENDVTKDVNTGCYGPGNPMSPTSGASNYYSPSNTNQANENQYIPDANGYPYTQTIYTPDNTGRISVQSGVGETHRIGTGKETKYVYGGPPNPADVNSLFGSEVGLVARYKKNLVVDANGQVSVSYLDAQGRVIATSLTGVSPQQLSELEGSGVADKTMNMLASKTSENDVVEGNKKTFSSTFAVGTKDEWIFDYNLQAKKFTEVCTDFGLEPPANVEKCYDCILDLQLLLTDQCGQQYLVNLPNFNPQNNMAKVGEIIAGQISSNNCTAVGPSIGFNDHHTAQLEVGSYTITRVLSVNEQAMNTYLNDFLTTSDCIIDLDKFIEDETNLNVSGRCDGGCTECLEDLGEYDQYNIALNPDCDVCLTPEEYEIRLQTCKDICDPQAVDCEMLENSMLNDMILFGQYAGVTLELEDNPETTTENEERNYFVYKAEDASAFPLSIFNEVNKLPQKKWFVNAGPGGTSIMPNWRFPYRKKPDGTVIYYYENEQGERAYVNINKIGDNYFPGVVSTQKVYTTVANGNIIKYYTDPENISDVQFFIANWDDSWAKSLLAYHPEYCYLEYCNENSSSYDFDDRWFSAEEVVAAPVGFIDPIGVLSIGVEGSSMTSWLNSSNPAFVDDAANTRLDPFFNPSINNSYNENDFSSLKNRMLRALPKRQGVAPDAPLSDFYNMWQLAYISVLCPDYEEVPGTGSSCDKSNCAATINNPYALLTVLKSNDKVWEAFKSMYYSAKREIVENRATQYAIKRGCYNGCIGKSNFDANADGFMAALYKDTKVETYEIPSSFSFWQHIFNTQLQSGYLNPYVLTVYKLLERFHTTYTKEVEFFQSQFYNPEQPCNNQNYVMYADADKAYIRSKDEIVEAGTASNSCMTTPVSTAAYAVDPSELDAITGPTCTEANQAATDAGMNRAAFELYQKCGQCPATKMLETFFDEVAATSEVNQFGLASQGLQVNCPPDGFSSFIKPLEEKFQYTKGAQGQFQVGSILWNATTSPDPNTLNVALTKTVNGVPQTANIVLVKKPTYVFKDLNTGIDHTLSFNWQDVKGICCFESIDVTAILLPGQGNPGYKFRGKARVEITFDNGVNIFSEKINIEGYTDKVILTCDPPVICETLPIATELSNLWNVLMFTSESFVGVDFNGNPDVTVPAISSKFTDHNFTIDRNISEYERGKLPYESSVSIALLTSLPAINSMPVLPPNAPTPVISASWKMVDPQIPFNKKTCLFELSDIHGATVGQYPFEFEISSPDFARGIDFEKFRRITQVTSDKTSSDPSRYFTAKVLVANTQNQMEYITIKGYSPTLLIGECKTAVRAVSNYPAGNGQ
jgi:hypothetical protein